MANYTEEQWNEKKMKLMETCFNGFAELGLHGTGIRTLAKHCGYNTSMIYTYFKDFFFINGVFVIHLVSQLEAGVIAGYA